MVILVGRIKKTKKEVGAMILIICDYTYQKNGKMKGFCFEVVLFYENGKFYRKCSELDFNDKKFTQKTRFEELSQEEIEDYKNFLPIENKNIVEIVKDKYIYEFYRNPYKEIHSYILTKIY
jgi:succinate dehydrogenase flavin-adding protein (antitoxin of CptAB toxin-antitoxin module)